MPGETHWWKYGACEECGADPGRPCLDLRFSRGRSAAARPHPGRHVKGWLPRAARRAA